MPFKCLFIVHTKAIRDASYMKFRSHFSAIYPKLSPSHFIKIETFTTKNEIKASKFIFCLFQSFEKLNKTHPSILKELTHIIFDEIHHLLAPTWKEIFKKMQGTSEKKTGRAKANILGMTATLSHREDPIGKKLKRMF